ncbi:required for meiotic nuclear division protein 1 homolog isoform X2 [Limulus polyphemus]|uniref:Required for meiotic nuclear division protein 1 homolog isoform X2 n=1 Tax=Limulus polyphemus TaxID=6850 RepID=A0ABM1S743_LIMPO|nr:required for meiotic nuclear division protein 1 homolog isoform X2 [Limulus polyphemus]
MSRWRLKSFSMQYLVKLKGTRNSCYHPVSVECAQYSHFSGQCKNLAQKNWSSFIVGLSGFHGYQFGSSHLLFSRGMSLSNVQDHVQSKVSPLQAKKRVTRKKISLTAEADSTQDWWSVVAYSTAEEYDLSDLIDGLKRQGLYQQSAMPEDMNDVLHVCAKYQVDKEPREAYFFSEGSVVFWNVPEIEQQAVLKFLKAYETNSYEESIVSEEKEVMEYLYTDNKTRLINGQIMLNSEGSTDLEKYAFSNGLALSVKLAIWEASLEKYVDSIDWITEEMKIGKKISITRDQVFQKSGEIFALRHLINLCSDLLDTPDFYWDKQNLEALYHKTCNHLSVTKRTKVLNEKINHCCELMELLSGHLNDRHHVRLELMIIALIMVEVGFEVLHFARNLLETGGS